MEEWGEELGGVRGGATAERADAAAAAAAAPPLHPLLPPLPPNSVEVVCGEKAGTYKADADKVECHCQECAYLPIPSRMMTVSRFEAHSGRAAAKQPKRSIKIRADGTTLHEWQETHHPELIRKHPGPRPSGRTPARSPRARPGQRSPKAARPRVRRTAAEERHPSGTSPTPDLDLLAAAAGGLPTAEASQPSLAGAGGDLLLSGGTRSLFEVQAEAPGVSPGKKPATPAKRQRSGRGSGGGRRRRRRSTAAEQPDTSEEEGEEEWLPSAGSEEGEEGESEEEEAEASLGPAGAARSQAAAAAAGEDLGAHSTTMGRPGSSAAPSPEPEMQQRVLGLMQRWRQQGQQAQQGGGAGEASPPRATSPPSLRATQDLFEQLQGLAAQPAGLGGQAPPATLPAPAPPGPAPQQAALDLLSQLAGGPGGLAALLGSGGGGGGNGGSGGAGGRLDERQTEELVRLVYEQAAWEAGGGRSGASGVPRVLAHPVARPVAGPGPGGSEQQSWLGAGPSAAAAVAAALVAAGRGDLVAGPLQTLSAALEGSRFLLQRLEMVQDSEGRDVGADVGLIWRERQPSGDAAPALLHVRMRAAAAGLRVQSVWADPPTPLGTPISLRVVHAGTAPPLDVQGDILRFKQSL